MPETEHSQGRLVKNLVTELLQVMECQHEVSLTKMLRVNSIVSEAAESLRSNFILVDKAMQDLTKKDNVSNKNSSCQKEYRQIITTLQFEDIVSQIICQQIEHGHSTKRLIKQVLNSIDQVEEEYISDHIGTLLLSLRQDVKSHLAKNLDWGSVSQQNLAIGETELF